MTFGLLDFDRAGRDASQIRAANRVFVAPAFCFMPRGKHNSKRGRSPGTRKPKLVKLEPKTIAIATQIGDGVLSDGLNKIFARMTTFDRVMHYLESRAEEDEIAESLLLEMQELGIERDYEEAIAPSAIELPNKSWIV